MRWIFILIALFAITYNALCQPAAVYQSAMRLGSAGSDDGKAVAVDASGNIYITGQFTNTIDFDPGAGTTNLVSVGSTDIFIAKYSSTGTLAWARSMGSTAAETGTAIAVDASGNVYVSGLLTAGISVDLDPGAGSTLQAGRIFTVKLNSSGTYQWSWSIGTAGNNITTIVDASGNLYSTGSFTGTSVDFDPGAGITARTASTMDIFVQKVDVNGNLVWAKTLGSSGTDSGEGIVVNSSSEVFVTGYFQNTATFDDAGAVQRTSFGGNDAFILKLNSAGTCQWAQQIGGTGNDAGSAIDLDTGGKILLGGTFAGTADFDPSTLATNNVTTSGTATIFVSKYDASGNFSWVKAMQGTAANTVADVDMDSQDAIFLSGTFQNSVDFDPSSATTTLSASNQDVYIQKLNPTGDLVWVYKIGASGIDNSNAMLLSGSFIYMTGAFSNTVDFDPGTGTASLTSAGASDIFASKLSDAAVSLTFSSQPSNASICAGSTGTLDATAIGTSNITYQWQKYNSTTTTYQDLVTSTAYTGTNSNTLSLNNVTSSFAGQYRVRASGDFVANIFSNVVTVTVNSVPPAPSTTPVSDAGCGKQTYTLTATSSAAGEFRWWSAASGGVPEAVETVGTFTTPVLSASTNYYVSFSDGTCESSRTSVAITVNSSGPGTLDPSFSPVANGTSSISFIDQAIIQPDGKILLNSFEAGGTEYYLSRLNTNGTVDGTFNNWDQTLFDGYVDGFVLQPDGKIVFAGRFTTINGTGYGRIARTNSNGTIDATFNATGPGFNNNVTALVLQPDGKIIVGGAFTSYNGQTANRIVRINSNGTTDATFNIGTGLDGLVSQIVLQPDGKAIVSGAFSTYNGSPVSRVFRLNADGTVDAAFNAPSVSGVEVMYVQSDNKILIGGNFSSVGGVSRNNIARLNSDGSHDTSFNPGTGADSWVYGLYEDSNKKILVGGWFTSFNGETRNFIARLRPDGSLDNFFNAGVGPYSLVTTILPYSTNKILVGGYIDSWNATLHNGLGVLANECIINPKTTDGAVSCSGDVTLTACGGLDGQYRWYTQSSGGTAIAGQTNSTLSLSNINATTTYYVTLNDGVCESSRVPVKANVTTVVTAPTVTSSSACSGVSQTLTASGAINGQYRWYTSASGGTAISGEVNSTYTPATLSNTTTFYVSINNGTCETARTSVTATVNALPAAPSVTDGARCGTGSVTLSAGGATAGQYRWYTASPGGTAISGETSATYATASLSANTTYYVAINNGTCESPRTSVNAIINPLPASPIVSNSTACTGATATLSASGGTNGNYRWYTTATGGSAIPNENNGTFITPTLTVSTSYFVSIVANGCESVRSRIDIVVSNCAPNAPPVINETPVETQIGGTVVVDLVNLISDPDGNLDLTTLQISVAPSSGASATIDSNGRLILNYTSTNFAGRDKLTIKVCDKLGSCTERVLFVDVVGNIIIYTAISPNGDGVNDIFRIEYIDLLTGTKENTVTIFNRWGDKIFQTNNYDNVNRVFRGLNDNGTEVSTGTYFFKIEFPSGRKMETGYLSLRR